VTDELNQAIGAVAVKVTKQGKAVIEPDSGGFRIMLPDGAVVWKETKTLAENVARRWFKANAQDGIAIGEIEWRF
jgi:hypothetical protein